MIGTQYTDIWSKLNIITEEDGSGSLKVAPWSCNGRIAPDEYFSSVCNYAILMDRIISPTLAMAKELKV